MAAIPTAREFGQIARTVRARGRENGNPGSRCQRRQHGNQRPGRGRVGSLIETVNQKHDVLPAIRTPHVVGEAGLALRAEELRHCVFNRDHRGPLNAHAHPKRKRQPDRDRFRETSPYGLQHRLVRKIVESDKAQERTLARPSFADYQCLGL